GVTSYIDADFHYPEQIIADANNVLDFGEPTAVLVLGVLGYAEADPHDILSKLLDPLPSGSYLALWDGTDDSQAYTSMRERYLGSGAVPYFPRPREVIEKFFDGFEMVEPGFVSLPSWHPGQVDIGEVRDISAYGALARKP
ncbi:SAM-dependent methyltransferase, partial [Streptomyces roseolus]|uniref:SAM-dependent methyltransferase n=1 Tax=Streptomyces roseolus TaxID=67358 RepID=UPI003664AF59